MAAEVKDLRNLAKRLSSIGLDKDAITVRKVATSLHRAGRLTEELVKTVNGIGQPDDGE